MPLCLAVLILASAPKSQTAPPGNAHCKPVLIHSNTNSPDIHAMADVQFKGYKRSPIVKFAVDEQGTVHNAKVKRSSGSATADDYALSWVRHLKYKPLPGCGTLESQAMVIIDFTAAPTTP